MVINKGRSRVDLLGQKDDKTFYSCSTGLFIMLAEFYGAYIKNLMMADLKIAFPYFTQSIYRPHKKGISIV